MALYGAGLMVSCRQWVTSIEQERTEEEVATVLGSSAIWTSPELRGLWKHIPEHEGKLCVCG